MVGSEPSRTILGLPTSKYLDFSGRIGVVFRRCRDKEPLMNVHVFVVQAVARRVAAALRSVGLVKDGKVDGGGDSRPRSFWMMRSASPTRCNDLYVETTNSTWEEELAVPSSLAVAAAAESAKNRAITSGLVVRSSVLLVPLETSSRL